MNGRPQPVRVTPGGQLYPSLWAACVALGIKPNIYTYKCCRTGRPYKGYIFDPVEPDDPDWLHCPKRRKADQFRRARAVRCIETGQVFASAAAAGQSVFISASAIYQSITRGCRAAEYHWVWAEEDTNAA